MNPTEAERQYLRRRTADGTLLELARAHNTMSAIRARASHDAMGTENPDEPDPTDGGNPFVVLAESAKALQFALAALLELHALLVAEREARRRRDRVVFGGVLLVFLAACAARFLPVAGWSGP